MKGGGKGSLSYEDCQPQSWGHWRVSRPDFSDTGIVMGGQQELPGAPRNQLLELPPTQVSEKVGCPARSRSDAEFGGMWGLADPSIGPVLSYKSHTPHAEEEDQGRW